jgi:flagellar M-ring protein FliF
VRRTEESVLGAPGTAGHATGTVVRERQVTQDGTPPLDAAAGAGRNGNNEHEVEYQVGRRVEQIVSQPGSIQQIQVVALVRKPLGAEEVERLKRVVAAAAGTSVTRGDTVEVQPFEQPAAAPAGHGAEPAPAGAPAPIPPAAANGTRVIGLLGGILAVVVAGAGIVSLRRSKPRVAVLSHEERAAALQQIRLWLEDDQHKEAT